MAEKKTAARKTAKGRSFSIPMGDDLTREIREVAATVGVPVHTVRSIAQVPALDALDAARGNVLSMVGEYFATVAAKAGTTTR